MGICTKTLSFVFVSTFTSNCCTWSEIVLTSVSINGVLKLSPGAATRENLPKRCTTPACAVSIVKNDPKTVSSTMKKAKAPNASSTTEPGSMRTSPSCREDTPSVFADKMERLDFSPKGKHYCSENQQERYRIIPPQPLAKIKIREKDEYGDRHGFLNDLQLVSGELPISNPVRGNLKAIFAERDQPAKHDRFQ